MKVTEIIKALGRYKAFIGDPVTKSYVIGKESVSILDDICKECNIKTSFLIRLLVEDFISDYRKDD